MIKLKSTLPAFSLFASHLVSEFSVKSLIKFLVMEARMKLYQDEIKDAGRELMVAGMKLRSPHGKSDSFSFC